MSKIVYLSDVEEMMEDVIIKSLVGEVNNKVNKFLNIEIKPSTMGKTYTVTSNHEEVYSSSDIESALAFYNNI